MQMVLDAGAENNLASSVSTLHRTALDDAVDVNRDADADDHYSEPESTIFVVCFSKE